MTKNLYVIKDDCAGSFDFYGVFPHDAVAERSFRMATKGADVPVTDLSLYRLGSFDSESGTINSTELVFLLRGEKNEI